MKEKTKTNSAIDYIGYALYAFGGLGMELLLMMLETNLYGRTQEAWSSTETVAHWLVTCLVWGVLGLLLAKQLPAIPKEKIQKANWTLALMLITGSVAYTSFVWNGFKPAIEFLNLGLGNFLVQYGYYAFESLLMLLIIAHGQKAFEQWFRNARFVPFGGLLLALTWGLIHIVTQGSATGLYAVIQALLYGIIYLVFKKDYKISYVVIALIFML